MNLEYIKEEIDKYVRNMLLEYVPKEYCEITLCVDCPFNSDNNLDVYLCDLL